jgi:hypothetical protein
MLGEGETVGHSGNEIADQAGIHGLVGAAVAAVRQPLSRQF